MVTVYEKVKVPEIPLSSFENAYEYDNEGGVSKVASAFILGDNDFASDENYGTREKELMLAALSELLIRPVGDVHHVIRQKLIH